MPPPSTPRPSGRPAPSAELLETVFEAVAQPLYVIDANTYRVVMANSAARLKGEPGSYCYAATHDRDRPCGEGGEVDHLCPLVEVKRTRQPVRVEHVHHDSSGEPRFVEIHAYPLLGAQGEVEQMVEFCLDVTDRRRLEEEVRQAQKLEVVGRLAGGVAHDFSNFLTVVLGCAGMVLYELPEDSPHRSLLEVIVSAGKRAATLTRRLLTFSRTHSVEARVLDLNALVEGYEGMLGRMLGANVQLTKHLGLRQGHVRADPLHLEQVLANLAINARHAMPSGGELHVGTADQTLDPAAGVERGLAPGEYVSLSVRDTGCGMEPDVLAKIFEPFFTTKPAESGTGLGLSTSRDLVQLTGGGIFAESQPGKGSTFTLLLPRIDGGHAEEADPVEEHVTGGGETILLLEDYDDLRQLTQRLLQRSGYTVLAAANAGEALLISERHPETIDLLLADVLLPLLSGPELAERLAPLRPNMRVLFVSGYHSQTTVGVDPAEVLLKPYEPPELLRRIRFVLDADDGS